MDFDEYQDKAYSTAVYPSEHRFSYPIVMISSEAGELAGKYSKLLRGDRLLESMESDPHVRTEVLFERGDILWGLAALAYEMGVPLSVVATMNLQKLDDRKDRGVIRGSGDSR